MKRVGKKGLRLDQFLNINNSALSMEIYYFYLFDHKNDIDFTTNCKGKFFGFHIHEGTSCTGNSKDEFANSKSHYNPTNCPHPFHSGDLPPLLENNGFAYSSFLVNKFTIKEIIGKTIIIHSLPDDFNSQPSGNSGTKIACGKIK